MAAQVNALANAARLKGLNSPANMASYDDIFAGPEEGHVPTAWEQQSGDRNADSAETALGAGPASDALTHAFEQEQRQKFTASDNAADDFKEHGLERGLVQSNIGNQLADINSEADARRHTLPYRSSLEHENTQDAQTMAQLRYLMPAQIQAQGNVQGHQAEAQGRIGAAQTHEQSLPMRGLMEAITELTAKGKVPTPEDIAKLKTAFGVQ